MRSESEKPGAAISRAAAFYEALGAGRADARDRARLHIGIMLGLIEGARSSHCDPRCLQELKDQCCLLLDVVDEVDVRHPEGGRAAARPPGSGQETDPAGRAGPGPSRTPGLE